MTIGFTKSKEDSNLFFKVEGIRLVMLLLYIDDLFLKEVARRRLSTKFEMKDLDMMHYFSRHEGVAECRWNLPGTREVCSRYPEVVRGDGMQGHE